MKKINLFTYLCVGLALSFLASPVSAQVDWNAVENQIEGIRSSYNLPSIGFAVVVGDTPEFTGAVGKANISENIDATADTPYMLASISKTFIAAALLQLIEDGLLSLDDPANDHLPWVLDNPRVRNDVIRVSHMVSHTSGIKDAPGNWADPPCDPYSDPTCFYFEGDVPAGEGLAMAMEEYFVPGGLWYDAQKNFTPWKPEKFFNYSNYTASLAGYLVECITGTKLRDHTMDNLLIPLGMTNSGWTISNFPDPLLVAMPYDSNNNPYGQFNWAEYPDGQMRTSPNDMAEYMAVMLGGGISRTGVRVLESASVDTAFADVFPGNVESEGQGVFWYRRDSYGEIDIGHNGVTYGVRTDLRLLLDSQVGVIVMVNQDGSNASSALGEVMSLLVDRGREVGLGDLVPDVVDMDQATAEAAIIAAGFVVGNVTTASSPTVPAGDVISQNPAGGESAAAGTSVDLVVSTGSGGCTPTDMHIESASCALVSCGGPRKNGRTTATIYDDCGDPVSGALVDVTFTGSFSETTNDVATNGSGVAVVTTSGCVKKPSFTATVIDVTGSLPYDSNDDVTNGCFAP